LTAARSTLKSLPASATVADRRVQSHDRQWRRDRNAPLGAIAIVTTTPATPGRYRDQMRATTAGGDVSRNGSAFIDVKETF
jgi:hypothetical protein